jgi:hypothetical protein
MDGVLFDETALGPPAAPSDSRRREKEPPILFDETDGQIRKPSAPRGKRVSKKDQELADLKTDLTAEARKFGAMITPVLPTTGAYTFSEGPEAMAALVDLAKDNVQALAALQAVAKAMPGVKAGRFVAGLGVSAFVDFRKVKPDSVAARSLGVTEVWVKTHPKEAEESGVYIPEPSPVDSFPSI